MDQQGQPGVPGPAGRRLHIAHRRSPSELTPLMSTSLPLVSNLAFATAALASEPLGIRTNHIV